MGRRMKSIVALLMVLALLYWQQDELGYEISYAAEEETEEKPEEKPEVQFSEELLENHNYIVLYFDNDIDWLQAKSIFNLQPVKDLSSKTGYERRGTGRVVRGADAINKLLRGDFL